MKKRILFVQSLEDSYRCLDEGVLRDARDGDIGSIFGWGFAPYSGGALSFIDYVGAKEFALPTFFCTRQEPCASFTTVPTAKRLAATLF